MLITRVKKARASSLTLYESSKKVEGQSEISVLKGKAYSIEKFLKLGRFIFF